jgi:polyadenylation factor subunit 2
MKEFRLYKGHKREVCCECAHYILVLQCIQLMSFVTVAIAWHPVHALIASGGSEGDLLYWDLHSPTNTTSANTGIPSLNVLNPSGPRATLSQAHDSNIWSLAFHPLGHLLVSASNDHTTRFWSRERPGDSTSVFGGGGEKPPEAGEGEGDEDDAWGEGGLPGLAVPGLYDQVQGGWETQMANGSRRDVQMNDDFSSLPGFDSGFMDIEASSSRPQQHAGGTATRSYQSTMTSSGIPPGAPPHPNLY